MSKYRPVLSGVIGSSVGSVSAFLAVRWLGLALGVALVVVAVALLLGAVEVWYRVIWPLDEVKPALSWSRHKT